MWYGKVLSSMRESLNINRSLATQNILFNIICMCWISDKVWAPIEVCALKKFQFGLEHKVSLKTKPEQIKGIKVLDFMLLRLSCNWILFDVFVKKKDGSQRLMEMKWEYHQIIVCLYLIKASSSLLFLKPARWMKIKLR